MMTYEINPSQLDWENCLTKHYEIGKVEVESILTKLPPEIKNNEQMTKLFLEKTKEIIPTTESTWIDAEDAICAAPESHVILADNHIVRVLQVSIQPGKKEPFHTHKWTSIMVVVQPSQLTYFTKESSRASNPPIGVYELKPEGLHSVENRGEKLFLAIRFEIKKILQINAGSNNE